MFGLLLFSLRDDFVVHASLQLLIIPFSLGLCLLGRSSFSHISNCIKRKEEPIWLLPNPLCISIRITLDEMRSSSEKSNDNRYASFPNMGDNHILFQSGKRRKEFPAQKADESVGDNATIGGNLTPITTTRTKIKLVKMGPAESLQPDSDIRIYNRNTSNLGSDDGTHELERTNAHCEKHARKEKIHVGGYLNMLVDAIQLVEDLKPQEVTELKAQKKDLVCFVPENIKQGNNFVGRPILQSNRYWANDGVDATLSQSMDAECIPDKVDVDAGEIMPLTRSRRGWLPTLPSKYSDSVLQPWKKVTRKVPKF